MAEVLNLPDNNYRPCRLIIDTDGGRFEVPYPLMYLCWTWRDVCGITARDYATTWRGDGVTITHVQVWLERHVPNYLPIAIERERTGKASEKCSKNCAISPGAYPAPQEFPDPPYP
jgi:hypothetical protein